MSQKETINFKNGKKTYKDIIKQIFKKLMKIIKND